MSERYEHEWTPDGKDLVCLHCLVDKSFRDRRECPELLRLALDAALAERDSWRHSAEQSQNAAADFVAERDAALAERDALQVDLDRISGALVDAGNAWRFDEDRLDEGVRFLTAERDALRVEHAEVLRLMDIEIIGAMDDLETIRKDLSRTSGLLLLAREGREKAESERDAAEARAERAEAFVREVAYMEHQWMVGLDAKARALLAPEAQR